MGRLQSRVLNTCIEPIACGNIGTGGKLAKFALDHTGAMRCCLESIYDAHETGQLDGDAFACRECPRIWELAKGWWAIGRRERAERFKRGHEMAKERIAAAQKRGASGSPEIRSPSSFMRLSSHAASARSGPGACRRSSPRRGDA